MLPFSLVVAVSGLMIQDASAFISPLPSSRASIGALRSTGLGSDQEDSTPSSSSSTSEQLPKVIPTKGVPIHLYTHDPVPEDCLDQLKVLAESPIPTDFVSAMPDVHLGKGVTIGSVFASEKYVCPNAVGVDIGCGMMAVPIEGLYKKDLSADQKNQIQQLLKEQIPTGFEQHSTAPVGARSVIDEITQQIEPESASSTGSHQNLRNGRMSARAGGVRGRHMACDTLF